MEGRKDGTINMLRKHADKTNVVLQNVNLGMPCSQCGVACPGFELHVWKKRCKHCGCSGRKHAFTPLPGGPDVKKLEFVEEVPENFDARGYVYDDCEVVAEPEEEQDGEEVYDNPQELLARLKGLRVEKTGTILSTKTKKTSQPAQSTITPINTYSHISHPPIQPSSEYNSLKGVNSDQAMPLHPQSTYSHLQSQQPKQRLPAPPPVKRAQKLRSRQPIPQDETEAAVNGKAQDHSYRAPAHEPPVRKNKRAPPPIPSHASRPPIATPTQAPEHKESILGQSDYESMRPDIFVCGNLLLSVVDKDVAPFLHHNTPRSLASAILTSISSQQSNSDPDGLFLVRTSLKHRNTIVISLWCGGKSHHYQFALTPKLTFENEKGRDFGTLGEMLAYFKDNKDKLCCCLTQCIAPQ
eukprot:m.20729 g.20729  ORF g.20729 m.20729 type:complete len:410 (-) comp8608_c0_seq1:27-1256(-)